jgi:cytochrome c-type biogenesis protein
MTGAIGFAALAGVLSTLSPCVLPLVPLALGAAASEHKLGPAALAAGLTLSYTIIGLFVATVGFAIGLDTGMFRAVAAVLLIGIGAILMASQLQERFAIAAGPIGNWTEQRFGSFSTAGLTGQFGVGVLLGAVWSPCVGPTLGAASVMAARRENLGEVALTMLAFGLGAALPLLILGLLSRETMMLWRDRLTSTGKSVKQLLGGVLVGVGVLILSGLDKRAEAWLVEASPQWLTDLTTRF